MERVSHSHTQTHCSKNCVIAQTCACMSEREREREHRILVCILPNAQKETGGNILSSTDLYCHILKWASLCDTLHITQKLCKVHTDSHTPSHSLRMYIVHCKRSCTYFSIEASKASKAKLSKMCNRQPNNGCMKQSQPKRVEAEQEAKHGKIQKGYIDENT